ncbi:MAG TPA: hypothetical protein PLZ55_03455 [bacterium]|nr:hypothetical protein [bacterium]HPO07700.1 hypothetical protein [bacterium]HQO34796.1 hypothetical protein [bacterium]HQP98145.1 hypothetical protein [bacterium]
MRKNCGLGIADWGLKRRTLDGVDMSDAMRGNRRILTLTPTLSRREREKR